MTLTLVRCDADPDCRHGVVVGRPERELARVGGLLVRKRTERWVCAEHRDRDRSEVARAAS